jgi:hypothetical protein
VAVAATILLAAPVAALPGSRTASQATSSPSPSLSQGRDATVGPLVSGTSSYEDGSYVWTDYAYDDRGPNTNGLAGGDTSYPSGIARGNVADLIQLQLRPNARGVATKAVLETLTAKSRPLIGIAFDLDGPQDGAASLPGSWQAAAPRGMDRLYLLGRDGGRELVADAAGTWRVKRRFGVRMDDRANTVAATLPLTGAMRLKKVRAVAAVGYQYGATSWVDGTAPLMDLAFVNDGWLSRPYVAGVALDASGFVTGNSAYWQDGVQSAILAGRRPPGPAVAQIDFAALRAGLSRPPPLAAGFQTFLYRSRLRLGEGIVGTGNESMYAGPFQPYLVHLPHHLRPGLPLVVYMHGASQTHTSPVNTSQYDPRTRVPVPLPDAIFRFDAVVAWPLGRGPLQNYWGIAEQDVLDVTHDVIQRLHLDRDRVMLAGLSLGGIGAYRLGELYPDRWSLVYADVGYDQAGLTSNLTDVPLRAQNAVADPLVNLNFALETRRNLAAAGTVDYMSAIQLRTTHQPAAKIAECVYRHAFAHPRRHAPPRVRYTIDPSMFVRNRATGLRLSYSGAYWVSGMRAAGHGKGAVDLVTHALGKRLVPGPVVSPLRQNLTAGRDFCGPNPGDKNIDVWSEQARHVRLVTAAKKPLLTGSLAGLSAVTVDAATTGLNRFRSAIMRLRSDHPLSLTVRGLRPGAVVTTRGSRSRAGADGRATVRLATGRSTVRLATG